ncbi:MAG: CRISPR system precrRNA processing endoribonuclease RAMP protein Cas6 [Chloroflexota bacterium]
MIPIDLQLYHIRFLLEAESTVHMCIQAGAQIRGALWYALNDIACTDTTQLSNPAHTQHCPACYLTGLQTKSPRGMNPPRPFTVRPPLGVRAEEEQIYEKGEPFQIELVIIGDAIRLFPYIVQAMRQAGQTGFGYGRGNFRLLDILNTHPVTQAQTSLLHNAQVQMPPHALTQQQVTLATEMLPTEGIRLRFLTPAEIKDKGTILRTLTFRPLFARLFERLQSLAFHYTEVTQDSAVWQSVYETLTQQASDIQRHRDDTRWIVVHSGSTRANRRHDISGLVGDVVYEGNMTPFLPYLMWGQSVHVGRNTIKGNGWYVLRAD